MSFRVSGATHKNSENTSKMKKTENAHENAKENDH
jgi:hypothetical protein